MTAKSMRPLWLIVIAAAAITFMSMGIRSTFGLLLEPISVSNEWSREVFSFTIALQNITWGLAQPFAGALADKYGSGRVMAAGVILYAFGLVMMGQVDTPLMMHLTGGIFVGLAQGMASMSIAMATVARNTPEHRRTLSMAFVTMGSSAGMLVMSPFAPDIIQDFGYIFTLMLLAAMMAAVMPMAWVLSGKPPVETAVVANQSFGEAIAEASRHRGYWLLIAGFFVCGFHVSFIGSHLPAFITDSGLDATVGGIALAVVGLFNIGGTLAAGLLGDRYSKKYLLSFLYFARALAILFLILMPITFWVIVVFSAVIGVLWLSTVPLTTGLVGQIFGPKYMAMLAGVVFFSHQVGSFLGVWLGGALFEATGSYDIVWWISVALGLLAALLHWPIDERPVVRTAAA